MRISMDEAFVLQIWDRETAWTGKHKCGVLHSGMITRLAWYKVKAHLTPILSQCLFHHRMNSCSNRLDDRSGQVSNVDMLLTPQIHHTYGLDAHQSLLQC